MMVRIPHTVNLVTELDTTHPIAQRLMALDNPSAFLSELFASVLVSEGFLDKINQDGTYAFVKLDN
jgi:hypothetical protein